MFCAQTEVNRVHSNEVYSNFELEIYEKISMWASSNLKGISDFSHEEVVKLYWEKVHGIKN